MLYVKELKESLVVKGRELIQKKIDLNHSAMITAQEGANSEKGMMGDKFESFREQLQIERDRYAELYDKALSEGAQYGKIDFSQKNEKVMIGTMVVTDLNVFLVAVGLGAMDIEGVKAFGISMQSPLYQAMAGKKVGESFHFNDKKYLIKDIV